MNTVPEKNKQKTSHFVRRKNHPLSPFQNKVISKQPMLLLYHSEIVGGENLSSSSKVELISLSICTDTIWSENETSWLTVHGIMPSFTFSWRNKREMGRKLSTYLGCLPVWGKLELGCFGVPTPESKCRSKGTPFFHAWLQIQPGAGLPELWLLLWMKRGSKNRKS